MEAKKSIVIEYALWVVFIVGAYMVTYQFDRPLKVYRYGAAGWPRAITIMLGIFVTAQFLIKVRESKKRTPQPSQTPHKSEPKPATGMKVNLKRLATFTLPFAYAFLLPRTGYFITTPVFLISYTMVLGERRPGWLAGISFLIYGLTLFFFTKLLYLPLPIGNWPGFYDISSLIVAWLA